MEIREGTHRFLRTGRDVETLMGFDQEVMDRLVATLGSWNESAVPRSLLRLASRGSQVSSPQATAHRPVDDHWLLQLVRALVSRLGEDGRSKDAVIKHCGHILADILHGDDEDTTAGLVLKQATLLANDFLQGHAWDVIGLCWRGQLACLEGDYDLSIEFADRVWKATASASAESVNQVISFFALAQRLDDWGHSS